MKFAQSKYPQYGKSQNFEGRKLKTPRKLPKQCFLDDPSNPNRQRQFAVIALGKTFVLIYYGTFFNGRIKSYERFNVSRQNYDFELNFRST